MLEAGPPGPEGAPVGVVRAPGPEVARPEAEAEVRVREPDEGQAAAPAQGPVGKT